MATADFASRAVYNTYKNGSAVATTASDYRYIGYSNSTGTYKYSTCYKFVLPTIDGTISSITLTPELYNPNTGNLLSGRSWKIGISIGSTNSNFASGVYSVEGTYTKSFSLSSNFASGETRTMSPVKFPSVSTYPFSSGQTLYIYVYADKSSVISKAKITALTGSITYTPTTYVADKDTCTYSAASASPTSGTSDTSVTFSVETNANNYQYIYGNLNFYLAPAGYGYGNPVKSVTGYANGAGAKLSLTYSATFSGSDLNYKSTASRYTADPGDVTCTVSNISSSGAKITVPTGITTTFLNSYYYVSSKNYLYTESYDKLNANSDCKSFSRSTGYVDLTGLASGTSYTRYIYAYNKYNGYYYGIGSVSFTTDASSYTGNATASVTSSTTTTISCTVNTTTNLDGNIYYSKTSGLSSKPSTSFSFDSNREGSKDLTGLSAGETHTYYFYVYSSASGNLYSIGSVSFTTDASSYSATIIADVTGSTSAILSISNLNSTANLDNNWYLSEDSSLNLISTKYFTCTTTTSLPSDYSQKSEYSYEASIDGRTFYLQFLENIPSGTTLILNSGNNGYPISSNNISVYTSQNEDTRLSSTKLTFTTVIESSPTNAIIADRDSTVEISSLSVSSSYTRYAYVYSTVSKKYYQVGSVTFNTHSYIYYADSGGNLIPCWTYILDGSELKRVLLDIPNYKIQ